MSAGTAVALRRATATRQRRKLPSAPLVALVETHGGFAACAGAGQNHTTLARAWARAKADGVVTWKVADQLAITLLGLHPLLVWGDEWLEVLWELEARPSPTTRKRLQGAS